MKIKWFILAALSLLALSVNGQQDIPSLYKSVTLPAENLRFDVLIRLVTQQTGIRFSLNTQKFRPSRIIHVPKGVQRVDEILTAIQKTTGIHYTLLGDHIIFIDSPPVNPTATARKRPGNDLPPTQALPTTRTPSTTQAPSATQNPSRARIHPVAIASTAAYMSRKSINATKLTQTAGALADTMPLAQKHPATVAKSRQTTPTPSGFFAAAGLTADETFYINPGVQAGWPFFYGIVQWSSNFTVSGIRYGAGGSLRLVNQWRLGLIATTGNNSKVYPTGLGGMPMTVKTSLQKIGLLAQTRFSRNIELQFGPVLNILTTNYYNAIGGATPVFVGDADADQYIKPIYTIQDTYSSFTTGNTKVWIGLQASVFYSINFPGSR